MNVAWAPDARRAITDADLASATHDTLIGQLVRARVHTYDSLMQAMSRAARVLHPYSVAEAEELADRWVLDEARLVALDEMHRLEYLAGAK